MSSDTLAGVAAEATGDQGIFAAGIFETKGAALKRGAGAGLGSLGGDALGGDLGGAIGGVAGAVGGIAASAKDGALEFLVAVGPSNVYVFVPTSTSPLMQQTRIRHGDIRLTHTLNRATLEVTAKAHMAVRTLVLEDHATGDRAELEGRRLGWTHSKEVVKALVAADHDETEAEQPAPAT